MEIKKENGSLYVTFGPWDWKDRKGGARDIISGIKVGIQRQDRTWNGEMKRWEIVDTDENMSTLKTLGEQYLSPATRTTGHRGTKAAFNRLPSKRPIIY